jgi:hypothetical protein
MAHTFRDNHRSRTTSGEDANVPLTVVFHHDEDHPRIAVRPVEQMEAAGQRVADRGEEIGRPAHGSRRVRCIASNAKCSHPAHEAPCYRRMDGVQALRTDAVATRDTALRPIAFHGTSCGSPDPADPRALHRIPADPLAADATRHRSPLPPRLEAALRRTAEPGAEPAPRGYQLGRPTDPGPEGQLATPKRTLVTWWCARSCKSPTDCIRAPVTGDRGPTDCVQDWPE